MRLPVVSRLSAYRVPSIPFDDFRKLLRRYSDLFLCKDTRRVLSAVVRLHFGSVATHGSARPVTHLARPKVIRSFSPDKTESALDFSSLILFLQREGA